VTDVAMVPTTINGRWNLLLPEHRAARPEWTGWEVERVQSMHANLRPGMVLYDIGTEEGDLSALYASWVADAGRCPNCGGYPATDVRAAQGPLCWWQSCARTGGGGAVLFEPNPRVWPNIRAIWEANALAAPIATWVGFAGSGERVSREFVAEHVLPRDGKWPACASGPLIGDHGFLNLSERPDVPSITIDQMAAATGRPPDAITIDVEGAELHVLRGADHTLTEQRPLVWCSVHPEFMFHMYDQYERDLHDWMHDHRYWAVHLGYDHEHHVLFYPIEREDAINLDGASPCR